MSSRCPGTSMNWRELVLLVLSVASRLQAFNTDVEKCDHEVNEDGKYPEFKTWNLEFCYLPEISQSVAQTNCLKSSGDFQEVEIDQDGVRYVLAGLLGDKHVAWIWTKNLTVWLRNRERINILNKTDVKNAWNRIEKIISASFNKAFGCRLPDIITSKPSKPTDVTKTPGTTEGPTADPGTPTWVYVLTGLTLAFVMAVLMGWIIQSVYCSKPEEYHPVRQRRHTDTSVKSILKGSQKGLPGSSNKDDTESKASSIVSTDTKEKRSSRSSYLEDY